MKKKQKPLSFSLCEENIAYVEQQHGIKHRNKSHWMDDLLTHLRNKSEANTELVVTKKEAVKRFTPPLLIDVLEYMSSRTGKDERLNAEKFCDHFESNGWKVGGKTKMVSWKAAVRNFLKGNGNGNKATQNTGQKLSANERVKQRNDAKYRSQPDECGLGVGANDGHMGRTVDEGEGRTTIEHVDNGTFIDYE